MLSATIPRAPGPDGRGHTPHNQLLIIRAEPLVVSEGQRAWGLQSSVESPGNKGPLFPQSREGGPSGSDLGEAEGQEAMIHPLGALLEGAGLGAVRAGWKPGCLPRSPSHEVAFPRRGTRDPSRIPHPPASSQGALLPFLGSPPVLPSGCLPAGLWGRFRTLMDLGLCLWEGGWDGEAATIVSVQPSVRTGCLPRGASAARLPPAG